MSKSAKKTILVLIFVIGIPLLFFKSCVIYNPKPDDCEVIISRIIELKEGPTFDILFKTAKGETYYINRGTESGLKLDELNSKILNRNVTMYVVNLAFGSSKHIAQLQLADKILYSEF